MTSRPLAVVFAGPTLAGSTRMESAFGGLCGSEWAVQLRPPAAQGDVAAAVVEAAPAVIVLIDGVYERQPAVWHKELLWAMTRGCWVLGAASMGALRAAELRGFGMIGVGQVFSALADGQIWSDDEVAVAHLGAEDGFRPTSEALVNVRATLAAAARVGTLSPHDHDRLLAAAERLHYARRSWPEIAAEAGIAHCELSWTRAHRVDVKRDDAVAALAYLRDHRRTLTSPYRAAFALEDTANWTRIRPAPGRLAVDPEISATLADELRLDAEWDELLAASLLRVLAVRRAPRLSDAEITAWTDTLRARLAPAELADLTPDQVRELAAVQAATVRAWRDLGAAAEEAIPDVLRIRGRYAELLERATRIVRSCRNLGLPPQAAASPEALGTDASSLRGGADAASLGFADDADLLRAAARRFAAERVRSRSGS